MASYQLTFFLDIHESSREKYIWRSCWTYKSDAVVVCKQGWGMEGIGEPRGARPPNNFWNNKTNAFNTHSRIMHQLYQWCPCISVGLEATHTLNWLPLKGATSAQKALQEFKTETRKLLGGAKEKSDFPIRGIDLPSRHINDIPTYLTPPP